MNYIYEFAFFLRPLGWDKLGGYKTVDCDFDKFMIIDCLSIITYVLFDVISNRDLHALV
jgi:hypothetical protein